MARFSAADLVKIRSAKAWRITPEDVEQHGVAALAGTIFAIVPREGDYGRYPVVIIDSPSGETYAVHAFHSVLFNNLKEIKAASGMDVLFSYAGMRDHNTKTNKDGSAIQYHDWTVVPADGADIDVYDFSTDVDELDTPNF